MQACRKNLKLSTTWILQSKCRKLLCATGCYTTVLIFNPPPFLASLRIYHKCLGESLTADQEAGEYESDPEWKKSADYAIRRRDALENRKIQDVSSPEAYEEDFVDVEDLMTKPADQADRDCLGDGFRSTSALPTQRQIEMALKAENEILAEKKIRIRRKVNDESDALENIEEEKATSKQGCDGVSRVRRDVFVTLKQKPKTKKKGPTPNSLRDEANEEANQRVEEQETLAPSIPHATVRSVPARTTIPRPALASVSRDLVDLSFDNSPSRLSKESVFKATGDYQCSDSEYYQSTEPMYKHSTLVLSSPDLFSSDMRVKTIAVTTDLEKHMKQHQKEGVHFMWRNAFIDLNVRTSNEQDIREKKEVGGCIRKCYSHDKAQWPYANLLHYLFLFSSCTFHGLVSGSYARSCEQLLTS